MHMQIKSLITLVLLITAVLILQGCKTMATKEVDAANQKSELLQQEVKRRDVAWEARNPKISQLHALGIFTVASLSQQMNKNYLTSEEKYIFLTAREDWDSCCLNAFVEAYASPMPSPFSGYIRDAFRQSNELRDMYSMQLLSDEMTVGEYIKLNKMRTNQIKSRIDEVVGMYNISIQDRHSKELANRQAQWNEAMAQAQRQQAIDAQNNAANKSVRTTCSVLGDQVVCNSY